MTLARRRGDRWWRSSFDFVNGFHDAANSIATVVSTRVLSPRYAVIWAAFFNFIAFLIFQTHVATTIGKGVVDPQVIDTAVVFAALTGAIAWDLITWWFGIPSSSSHALIGGLAGAGRGQGGGRGARPARARQDRRVDRPLAAPRPRPRLRRSWSRCSGSSAASPRRGSTPWFRRGQLVSAALYSLGHGGNDAQKTMGIIAVLLYANGILGSEFYVPLWVVLACHAAMGLGTLSGGWRIVRTMGLRITKLQAGGRLLRGDRRRHHALPRDRTRHPGVDHAHHHRRDRRRRLGDQHARPCAGASPAGSSGHGSSPSRAPRSSRASTWLIFH